jgi:hypothetical protein
LKADDKDVADVERYPNDFSTRSRLPKSEDLLGRLECLGHALAGFHQDTKVFRYEEGRLVGHNVLVHQVAIEDLACHGWRPQQQCMREEQRVIGHFHACEVCDTRRRMWLDYQLDANPIYNQLLFKQLQRYSTLILFADFSREFWAGDT